MCPYCGHSLPIALRNGLSSCSNCDRIFDSSPYFQLLSAAWLVRKRYIWGVDRLKIECDLTQCQAELIEEYISEGAYSHDEFRKVLDKMDVSSCALEPPFI